MARFISALLLSACLLPRAAGAQAVTHVIHISVDGLRPDVVESLGPVNCPSFHRLMVEGAFTLNARTDCDYTNTLPNHTCQLTGRAVLGPDGHGISFNTDTSATIEEIHGSYVAGAFDVAHDHGFETGLFTGKSKFGIFETSWDSDSGAPDLTGPDDGRDKIDRYVYMPDTPSLVDSFIAYIGQSLPGYAFLHLRDPDSDGHAYGWESAGYRDAVMRMDAYIGMVIELVESLPALAGSTAIIVTSDHGGTGYGHSDASDPLNYTVQFHAWGPGVPAGADIYALNPVYRLDPGTSRPACSSPVPPVRNGEAANASASLLGLPPVTGSTIGDAESLVLTAPDPLPLVSLVSPADGSSYAPDESISIEAAASSPAGISKVEFFSDWVKIGEDDSDPYQFLWDELPLGAHELAARAIDGDGYGETYVISVEVVSTTSDGLGERAGWDAPRVYPNPAGSNPGIRMFTAAPGPVEVTIFDAAGRTAGRQVLTSRARGYQVLEIDMAGYPSGMYFFRAVSGEDISSGKFVLIR